MLHVKYVVNPDRLWRLVQRAHATWYVKVTALGGHVKCPVTPTSEEAIMTDAPADCRVLIAITETNGPVHATFTKIRTAAFAWQAAAEVSIIPTIVSLSAAFRIAFESIS